MYITPTVTSWSNGSPVRPSKRLMLAARAARPSPALLDLVLRRRRRRPASRRGCRCCSLSGEATDVLVGQAPRRRCDVLVGEQLLQLSLQLVGRPVRLEVALDLAAERLRRPAKVDLEDLTDVHAARHAERVEDDVDRRAVLEVRHVLLGEDRDTTPLLPWRPAILSPTDSLRLMATYTLTILMTPGGSSSPFLSFGDLLAEDCSSSCASSSSSLRAARALLDLAVARLDYLAPVACGPRRAARSSSSSPLLSSILPLSSTSLAAVSCRRAARGSSCSQASR